MVETGVSNVVIKYLRANPWRQPSGGNGYPALVGRGWPPVDGRRGEARDVTSPAGRQGEVNVGAV